MDKNKPPDLAARAEDEEQPYLLTVEHRILTAMRRIMRSVDIYSRRLNREYKLTTPQLICMSTLQERGHMMITELSRQVSLSASTVNGIIDRLEKKELVRRRRSETDRRRVYAELTDTGRGLTEKAPPLLQDNLASELSGLPPLEQTAIALSLERVVELMGVEDVDASPNLLTESNPAATEAKEKE